MKPGYFHVPIVLSAFLLFIVQPIIAKQILPWFGGSASVWNTCLFFFQAVLLLGYTYAHALVRWVPPARQAALHIGLLALSLLALPVIASPEWKAGDQDPALRILLLLAATVGLPYFMLSTTSPLLQAWYSRVSSAPYRLFAVSNAASLGGLLAYPFLLEPALTTSEQAKAWSAVFVGFAVSCAAVAVLSARLAAPRAPAAHDGHGPGSIGLQWLSWLILSALGSLALVSVTSFVAQNIASMPLIWVVPLAIYLVTFILAFGRGPYRGWFVAGPALVLSLVMVATYENEDLISEFYWSLPVFMAGLFFICLYCHGELAATKPAPEHLTLFYILVSLGGALGSFAGSLAAPLLLPSDFEMPITLAAVAGLFAWQCRRDRARSRWAAMALAGVILLVSAAQIAHVVLGSRLLVRNFYSSLRIIDLEAGGTAWRSMKHGFVEHGAQYLDPVRRQEPISYYGATSGVSLAIRRQREVNGDRPLAIGVVGLGAGAIAAYGQTGERVRFYEINPQVLDLARREFTYLSDSKADVSVALGDARLVLEAEAPQNFDVLVIDAFSGDAIPMHLITQEALAVYRKHVKASGVLLFHISNRFVDLEPPLARLALQEKLEARIVSDEPEQADEAETPLAPSDWVLMAADKDWMNSPELDENAEPLEPPAPGRAWTDDFNNILSAIRLGGSEN